MRISVKDFQSLAQNNPKILSKYPELGTNGLWERKQNKYRNTKVYVYANGKVSYGEKDERYGKPEMIFDSIKEYERWNELKLWERAGEIENLKRQKELIIQEAGEYNGERLRKTAYKADFMYDRNGQTVVEDVKPFDKLSRQYKTTKDFALKWKLLKVKYPKFAFELY